MLIWRLNLPTSTKANIDIFRLIVTVIFSNIQFIILSFNVYFGFNSLFGSAPKIMKEDNFGYNYNCKLMIKTRFLVEKLNCGYKFQSICGLTIRYLSECETTNGLILFTNRIAV